jgi:hypothetical protein
MVIIAKRIAGGQLTQHKGEIEETILDLKKTG